MPHRRTGDFSKLGRFQKRKFWFFSFLYPCNGLTLPNLTRHLELWSLWPNQGGLPGPIFAVKNIKTELTNLFLLPFLGFAILRKLLWKSKLMEADPNRGSSGFAIRKDSDVFSSAESVPWWSPSRWAAASGCWSWPSRSRPCGQDPSWSSLGKLSAGKCLNDVH